MNEMRLLTGDDQSALSATLLREPLYNLFMIGNLEIMGLGAEELLYWGQFSSQGALMGVAMRYHVNWCFYAHDDVDLGAFAGLVDDYPHSRAINGHPDQVDPIIARLERYTVQELHASYYCRMPLDTALPAPAWSTRRATLADVDALVELYTEAGIMRRDADGIRRKLQEGRIVVVQDGEQLVASVLTSIETHKAAMIGGVFTPAPLRNRGYASAAMTHLCAELLAEGKQPCLFYDNPAAGSIYRRLGFEDIGPWHLVFLEPGQADAI